MRVLVLVNDPDVGQLDVQILKRVLYLRYVEIRNRRKNCKMKYNDSKNRMVTRNPYFSSTIKADEIVMYEVLQEALIYLTHLCLILILFENNFCDSFIKKSFIFAKEHKTCKNEVISIVYFLGVGGSY